MSLGPASPALPWVPWDVGSPPSRPGTQRSRPAGLCSAQTATGPPRGRSVLPRLPRSLGSRLWLCVPGSPKARGKGGRCLATPEVFPALGGTPAPDLAPRRPLALPRARVTPGEACPALRPRWCPAYSPYRIQDCGLPVTAHRRLWPRSAEAILLTTTLPISGLYLAAYFLVPSSFVRPLLGVHVECAPALLARR